MTRHAPPESIRDPSTLPTPAPAQRPPARSRALLAWTLGALVLGAAFTSCSCGRSKPVERAYPEPGLQDILDHLDELRRNARSFRAESVMDYWVGDERVKGTVLMMGRKGARVRINALNPTGDNVAADLACDGIGFEYIDYNHNCQLAGLCDRNSIARLLRIRLEPDDFLLMVMGTTPLIPDAQGTVNWDQEHGHEVLDLVSPDGRFTQTVVLDGRDKSWDLLTSEVRDARGNVLWRLRNTDFSDLDAADGRRFRVPGKSQLEQPAEKADLLVQWKERSFNLELETARFDMEIPPGLPSCE
ncbi:hypothetical protein [Haliangium sp.]|uniref:hypothetical protein n=1 Tax=Haliangium sp. TaxID=2663208 RepID=UPI003D11DA9A